MQREEALEVAMLAKAVGSHLVGVDQLTVERPNSGGPANKINMENFIAPILGKQVRQQNHEYGANPDMMKAYEGLNELALQSIPDVGGSMSPAPPIPLPNTSVQQPNSNIHAGSPVSSTPAPQYRFETNKEVTPSILTRSDVDSIRNSLKGIDKSLAALLNYMKNSKK
jgi:hypothetical protein